MGRSKLLLLLTIFSLLFVSCDIISQQIETPTGNGDGDDDSDKSNEISSNITSDRTLSEDKEYVVTSNVSVKDGAKLTIEPGVHLKFESGAALSVNSALVANGTESKHIKMTATSGNEQQGWWQGVAFYSSNQNNKLNYVEIQHAGSNDFGGIAHAASVALNEESALTLTNSTISDGNGYGVYIDGTGVSFTFSGNSFSGHKEAPLWIPFNNIGAVDSSSSFPNNSHVRVWGSNPTSKDITINALKGDIPYRLSGTPSIEDNASVTIKPGVEMEFESGVGISVSSVLTAKGTAADPITMTATPGNEQQGWWKGIAFYSNNLDNKLDHVQIKHAGKDDFGGIAHAASVALNESTALTLTNSLISDGSGYGVYIDGSDVSFTFSNNSFSGNGKAPLWIPFNNIGAIDSESSFNSGTYVRTWGSNATSRDITIHPLSKDVPYRLSGTPSIEQNASVTIEPGVEMVFESGVGISVSSVLTADGTSTDPITMTATSGNEQQGWWKGIAFYSNNLDNELNYVHIRHAGKNDFGGIAEAANIALNEETQLKVTNSEITDSGNHGLYCDGSTSSVTRSGNTYSNNAGKDISGCQ